MEAKPLRAALTLTGDCKESPTLAGPPWVSLFKICGVLVFLRGTKERRKTYRCPCSPNYKPKGMCTFYNQAAESCIWGGPQGRLSRRVMSSSP